METIYLCNLPVEVIDRELSQRIENYERYTYITMRTELGEATLIKGYKKRFIILLTGLHFVNLRVRVSITVVGDEVHKLGTDTILSELSELVNNEMYAGHSFSIDEPAIEVVEKSSPGEAKSHIQRIVELFLSNTFDEEYSKVYHVVTKYNDVESEYTESSEVWGIIIERAGLINFFVAKEEDDQQVYF